METVFPFDPIARAASVEDSVMKGDERLYHRFRAAPYYGGIATADAVGCSFLCAYCWNYGRNLNPGRYGSFLPASRVASNLLAIARKRDFHLYRITGSEPILGDRSLDHLLKVLRAIFREDPHASYILETNGFILGFKKELIEKLAFKNIQIRVSLKGTDPESFETISGAKREYFEFPIIALQGLQEKGLNAWPAIMADLFEEKGIRNLKSVLEEHGIKSELESETLEAYPFVIENLKHRKVGLGHSRIFD